MLGGGRGERGKGRGDSERQARGDEGIDGKRADLNSHVRIDAGLSNEELIAGARGQERARARGIAGMWAMTVHVLPCNSPEMLQQEPRHCQSQRCGSRCPAFSHLA